MAGNERMCSTRCTTVTSQALHMEHQLPKTQRRPANENRAPTSLLPHRRPPIINSRRHLLPGNGPQRPRYRTIDAMDPVTFPHHRH